MASGAGFVSVPATCLATVKAIQLQPRSVTAASFGATFDFERSTTDASRLFSSILAEGAIALPVTLSGGALFAS